MSHRAVRRAVSLLALVATALPLAAQGGKRDYLVGIPSARFAIRGGWDQPLARSDFFDFATDQWTLSRTSFGGASLAGELAFTYGDRSEVVIGAGRSSRSAGSEYRRFVETVNGVDLPIRQRTALLRVPLTIGYRYNVVPPGTAAGTLAFIPNRLVPWVQVGGGAMYSRLRQSGDFRFDDNSIETAEFRSSGWAPTAYGAAGVDIGITSRSSLVLDARYSWARERLRGDFDGFAPLDLSSLALTAGFAWRF